MIETNRAYPFSCRNGKLRPPAKGPGNFLDRPKEERSKKSYNQRNTLSKGGYTGRFSDSATGNSANDTNYQIADHTFPFAPRYQTYSNADKYKEWPIHGELPFSSGYNQEIQR